MWNIHTLIIEKVLSRLSTVSNHRHQLVFLVGNCHKYDFQQFAQQLNVPYINLSFALSSKLKDIPISKRPRKVKSCFEEIIDNLPGTTFLLDHIDVLFDPSLQLNPESLLKDMSRNHIFIIPWYGKATDTELIYAEPGHPEYFRYPHSEVVVISL